MYVPSPIAGLNVPAFTSVIPVPDHVPLAGEFPVKLNGSSLTQIARSTPASTTGNAKTVMLNESFSSQEPLPRLYTRS